MRHSFFLVMAFTILFGNVSYSQNKGNKNNSMTELGDPIRGYLNLNNISTVFKMMVSLILTWDRMLLGLFIPLAVEKLQI